MQFNQKLKKLLLGVGITSSAIAFSTASFAQSPFFFPSASFFSPTASFFETEDTVMSVISEKLQYETFYDQLENTELLESLPQDSLTVLAPTNEAFESLPPKIKAKLSEPENLSRLLQYHFVLGLIEEQDIKRQAVATLLDKSSVQITGIPLAGNKVGVKINQSIASDPIFVENGVIIPINEVLIPPGF